MHYISYNDFKTVDSEGRTAAGVPNQHEAAQAWIREKLGALVGDLVFVNEVESWHTHMFAPVSDEVAPEVKRILEEHTPRNNPFWVMIWTQSDYENEIAPPGYM